MAGKKIIKESVKPRFNSLERLAEVVDPTKMPMFLHKAKEVLVIAAKDTGKSFPVENYKVMAMELDPNAVCLTLMKHSTQAAKRGLRGINDALSKLMWDYDLPYKWEKADSFMYRMYHDKRDKLKNQAVEYNSFDNPDGLAGYTTGIGGYPFLIHIEEPVLDDGSETIDPNIGKSRKKTIIDTVERHYRDFKHKHQTLKTGRYYHEPLPFKIIITMNDGEPDHYESKLAEHYMPRLIFLDWCLGFEYSKLRRLGKDKINGQDVVPELKLVIDAKWEDIKKSVLENHTKWVYVEKDENGIKLDKLIGRMQKFANPQNRDVEENRESVFNEMYIALVTGNTQDLARVFGMGNDGNDSVEKRFNFKSFTPIDTLEKLKEKDRYILNFSMGGDHDANRGPVGTPCTYSGLKRYKDLGNGEYQTVYTDLKVMLHPQIEIEGYGKGAQGENTQLYHQMMIDASKLSFDQFMRNHEYKVRKGTATSCIFDDDDGSYVGKMVDNLQGVNSDGKVYFDWVLPLENKNGKIEEYGFGTEGRDVLWQNGIDYGMIMVDERNEKLVEGLKNVPKAYNTKGEVKRDTSGKGSKRLKDISNSGEYAWGSVRMKLHYMIEEEAEI